MKQEIKEFNRITNQFGFSCKKRKLEDGLWLNYAEKSMGNWSKVIKLFDSPNKLSITAGLEVPVIDQTMDILFPLVFSRNRMEYRLFQATSDRTNYLSMDSWLQETIESCDVNFSNIKNPGDLATLFAVSASRKKTPKADWRDVCKPWIAIIYLGRGKAAAIQAITEELKYAEKFKISMLGDYLFQMFFLNRNPRNLNNFADELNTAIRKLELINHRIDYLAEDFIFPDISPER
jgi:hypothetical protein